MSGVETVLIWLGKKVAITALTTGLKGLSSSYDNVQAYNEFKALLDKAHRLRPAECTIGSLSKICPVEGHAAMLYDTKAGGVHMWHVYNVRTMRGESIQIQFFESASKIFVWQYDANYEPVDKGSELDPVDALNRLKALAGLGVEAASPHVR